jgi:hypothetical protein
MTEDHTAPQMADLVDGYLYPPEWFDSSPAKRYGLIDPNEFGELS